MKLSTKGKEILRQLRAARPSNQKPNARSKPSLKPPMSIYLLKAESLQRYKIGVSRWPNERHQQIQTMSPLLLTMVFRKKMEAEKATVVEHYFHEIFAEKRLHGEWFDLDLRDLETIATTLNLEILMFDKEKTI